MFTDQPTTVPDAPEIGGLSVGELVDELATMAAHISAGMCRWLGLVGEVDRRGGWAAWGHRSCAEWLAWRCALTPRSAREHVRVARALSGLPLVWEAFSSGELSYAKVRALTRIAAPASEAELLELAAVLTASQLERALRAYRRVTTEDARELHEQERLEWYWDEDGSLVVRGRLAPEDGALFLQALEAGRERLWHARPQETPGSAEPPPVPRRPSNVDALVAVADAALGPHSVRSGGDRYQVVVHVEQAALARDHDGSCALADGPALAPETLRRLACDAALVTVGEHSGMPMSLGRKRRTIPPALRRVLSVRDGGCRFPGCECRRFLDAHHIRHWASGGETALDNLLLLCRRHHRLLHEGGYSVDRQLRFYDRHGRSIPPVPKQPPGSTTALDDSHRDLGISAKTCRSGHGDRMDLGLTVDALLGIIGGRRSRDLRVRLRPASLGLDAS